MEDMLVRLLHLPPLEPELQRMTDAGITIRRPNPFEWGDLRDWVKQRFGRGWMDETSVAFSRQPVTAFVAVKDRTVLGFAAYDCTWRGAFGPTGVDESQRGNGIGRALLLACLHAARSEGYVYYQIAGVGPADFYRKAVGAELIANQHPNVYDIAGLTD
jgi:predicted N-acetyltransferase YhbS